MTDKTGPREVTIKIPRLPRDKVLWLVSGGVFLITFSFAASILSELNKLKEQQKTAEERIKNEVLMPGGTTEYKTEFKPDKAQATEPSTPAAKPEPAPAPAPVAAPPASPAPAAPPAPPPAPSGPGNFHQEYSPPSYSGPSGPGNM